MKQKEPVRIYRCAKTAMQSGTAGSETWILQPIVPRKVTTDDVMGWSGGSPSQTQVKLKFSSCADAVHYAQQHQLSYVIVDDADNDAVLPARGKSYAANFLPKPNNAR